MSFFVQASGKLDLKEPFYRQFSTGVPVAAAQPQESHVAVPVASVAEDQVLPLPCQN